MGTKMVINEFVAYLDLIKMKATIHPKTLIITSFALCGFANFSSIAMQVGGIGELAPERRTDLAKLGVKALICGTLASYLSATIAGMLKIGPIRMSCGHCAPSVRCSPRNVHHTFALSVRMRHFRVVTPGSGRGRDPGSAR